MIADNAGALKDLKVIEMGQLIAGPFCGQLLGDMGADVVKIEPPEVGDPMRQWGNGEHKVWWDVIGRNKRSVTANLRVAEGQALARQLLADADVMIENFKPGTVEKWGLGPAELHAINPGSSSSGCRAMARPAPIPTVQVLAALARRWAVGAISWANPTARPAAWAFPSAIP